MTYTRKLAVGEIAATRELTPRSLLVAFATTVGLMGSYSTIGNAPLGLLVVPVTHALGIGRGTFGLLTGLALLIGAALTPFAGQAMDRWGVRRVILPGIVLLGLVQLLLAMIPRSVPLFASLLLLQGAVSCLLSPLAYAKVLALWFHRRRGVMLGIATAIGIGGGSGLCIALVSMLIAIGGWRYAYFGTGLFVLIVGAVVVAPFLHEPPDEVLSEPDTGERAHEPQVSTSLPGLTRSEAVRTKPVLLLMLLVVGCIGSLTTIMGHGPALLAGRGLTIGPAFLGCAAAGSLIGQTVSGALLDRLDTPKVGLPFALAALLGGLVILYFGTSGAIVLPAALIMGLGQGSETGLASYYISRYCGLRHYASIFGMVMALVTLSAGVFPALAGYVFDATGSYDKILPLIDLLLALPAVAILLMPKYRFKASAMAPLPDF